MPRGLYVPGPETIEIREYEDQPLNPHHLRIRTEFAAIKHGTLFYLFSGKSPFEHQRFDLEQRLFVERHEEDEPGGLAGRYVGDMAVGRVIEIGNAVTRFSVGDRVYCYGAVAETLTKDEDSLHRADPTLTAQDIVCFDPALYAYAAVRDARICLGDHVVQFGLGAIGLCTVQLLKRAGCLTIIAVDPVAKRRALAVELGTDLALDPTTTDVALAVRNFLGTGADIAMETSGHYGALHEAMRSVRQCARVVTLGYYKGKGSALELGAEWLHNRLELICSMPVWDNPMREYPIWNLERLERTVEELFKRQLITSRGVVDPIVPFEEAAQAFMDIYRDPSTAIKLGIQFDTGAM
jgi:threonine dehydrogenase-like Zn-dependent dehydrogenase